MAGPIPVKPRTLEDVLGEVEETESENDRTVSEMSIIVSAAATLAEHVKDILDDPSAENAKFLREAFIDYERAVLNEQTKPEKTS